MSSTAHSGQEIPKQRKCPTPNCDGKGNLDPLRKTHYSANNCPNRVRGEEEPTAAIAEPMELAAVQETSGPKLRKRASNHQANVVRSKIEVMRSRWPIPL